ncbi:MAG: YdeI/OmpD-associated family protein [Pseudomonadota bacterium]
MDTMDQLEIASVGDLWDWLAAHHGRTDGVLLITWKAADRARYVSRDAVLDALIAHGWIDGRRYAVVGDRTMQLISPRRHNRWAKSYRDRAARLIAEGRMHPAGQAAIAAAKAEGMWESLSDVDALIPPDDLLDAFNSDGRAWFTGAAPSYRRNVLRWIATAKTAPTRAKRIGVIAAHAAQGRKVPNY